MGVSRQAGMVCLSANPADFEKLADAVGNYLEVFRTYRICQWYDANHGVTMIL